MWMIKSLFWFFESSKLRKRFLYPNTKPILKKIHHILPLLLVLKIKPKYFAMPYINQVHIPHDRIASTWMFIKKGKINGEKYVPKRNAIFKYESFIECTEDRMILIIGTYVYQNVFRTILTLKCFHYDQCF